ncbi:MAG: DUF6077 domain-containing protein, partial [Lachnospiraceae bacterium]
RKNEVFPNVQCKVEKEEIMQKTIPEKIIEGSLVTVGLAEAAHLVTLFLKQPFHICTRIMAVLFLSVVFCMVIFSVIKKKKNVGKRSQFGENRFLKLLRVYPYRFLGIFLLITLQIIWNYWMHVPYLKGDITGETVQTILTTDSIYTLNPMTGSEFTAGMPMRLKILVLPTLYAAICKWTGIPVQILLYSIVPGIVLVLSYLVYSRWAVYLFPADGKKQTMFMLFVVLVYQFGCYSAGMDSFLIFFRGWQGAAFRAGIILPYALLCCLQEKWKSVLLCLLAEVCVVWTFYGLGYTFVYVLVVLGIKLVHSLLDRRR